MEIIDITSIEFGAIPNENTQVARDANFFAIHKAQKKVMDSDNINYSIFLPPGIYYFDKSIHIFQKIELFGTGKTGYGGGSFQSIIQFTEIDCSFIVHGEYFFYGNDYISQRKSSLLIADWLEMFPDDTSVTLDPEAIEGLPENYMGNKLNGAFSIIRDLQVWGVFQNDVKWDDDNELSINLDPTHPRRILMYSKSTGNPGIKLISGALLYRVQVSSFSGTGIEIDSETKDFQNKQIKRSNNADSWLSDNCIITNCGGHGIHTFGNDSQVGMCKGLRTISILGNGIFEASSFGNAYHSCYIYYTLGHGIRADAVSGYSTVFYSCAVERSSPNWIRRPAIVIGGNYSDFIDESMFSSTDNLNDIVAGGHIGLFERGWRMIDKNFTSFHIKNILRDTTLYLGHDQSGHENSLLGWKSEKEGNGSTIWWLKYFNDRQIWSIGMGEDTSLYFTTKGHRRDDDGKGFTGVTYLLLGSHGGTVNHYPIRLSIGGRAERCDRNPGPLFDADFDFQGDIKFNTNPTVGDYAGWIVAKKNGTNDWYPFGKIDDYPPNSETSTDGIRNNNGTLELLVDNQIIGAVDVDGNGWLLTRNGFKPIPPWNPLFDTFKLEMKNLKKEKIDEAQKTTLFKLQNILTEIQGKL